MTATVSADLDTSCYPEPDGSGGARTDGSESPGGTPPSPPPAPQHGVNVDPRVTLAQHKQAKRQVRAERKRKTLDRLASLDRSFWIAGAGIGVVVLGFLGVRSILGMQRDTALALAERANPISAQTSEEQPVEQVVVSGIPNPLAELKLTGQARWIIGEVNGELPPARSATVLSALLGEIDLCKVYVGLNDRAAVVVQFEPTPGYSPLVQCGPPAVVEVPQDLAPTAVAPTTTAPTGA